MNSESEQRPMSAPDDPAPSNPWFRLVVVVGTVFAVTVMSLLAASFGHPQAPVNRFLNRYGLTLVLIETAVFAAIAWQALAVDRRQTPARRRAAAKPDSPDPNSLTPDAVDSP